MNFLYLFDFNILEAMSHAFHLIILILHAFIALNHRACTKSELHKYSLTA